MRFTLRENITLKKGNNLDTFFGGILLKFVHNLKSNFLFLISEIITIALFFNFNKYRLLFLGIVFLVGAIFSLNINNIKKVISQKPKVLKIFGASATVLTCLTGIVMFKDMWCHSSIIKKLSDTININSDVFLYLSATIISVFSVYFLYHFLSIILSIISPILISIISKIGSFFKIQIVTSSADIERNLVSNIVLSISFIAFSGLNITTFKSNNIISYIISIMFVIILSSQFNDICGRTRNTKIYIKVISLITSIGICYYSHLLFKDMLMGTDGFVLICKNLNITNTILSSVISIFIMLLSLYSIYILLTLLYSRIGIDIRDIFKESSSSDKVAIMIILSAFLAFTTYSFANTQAFYGTNADFGVIYSSDSSDIVRHNVYMDLTNIQNDLRQPLFAVFASPFVGAGYLISLPLSVFCPYATPLIMNYCQIILLVLANFMIVKLMKLNSIQRTMLMIIFSLTYTTLLSSVMMEQYIVAYFWLIYMVYKIVTYGKAGKLEYVGASGSLLTSSIFLPLTSNYSIKNWKMSFRDMLKYIIAVFISICLFNRCDLFLSLTRQVNLFLEFTGKNIYTGKSVSFLNKLEQYSAFVSNCFIHPNASISYVLKYPTWQLSEVHSFNIAGIIIFVVAIAGFILNRKNKLCQISLFWVAFSFLLLALVGWGSAENGMILYSLYFSWAFVVLVYSFILSVSKKINLKIFVPIFSFIVIAVMVVLNFSAICDLLEFAIKCYPI